MLGAKNLILGLIFVAAGAAILTVFDLGGSVLVYVVWGLIGMGVIIMLGGLRQTMDSESEGASAEDVYKSDTIARLVMQSTITTALADGPLDDDEIEMIATACESVLHEHLDRNSVRGVARLVEDRGDAILDEIHSEGRLLNLDARKAVIDACVLVLVADGRVDMRQTAAVTAIARHMDFSEEETQAMIDAAMKEAQPSQPD